MNSQNLFVYGTLQSDAINENAKLLHSQARLLGKARWQGSLYLVSNYPAAVVSGDIQQWVAGELWQLNDPQKTLDALDIYEECAVNSPLPHEYERSIESIEINGEMMMAWIYLYQLNTDKLERIDSGIFVNPNQALVRRNKT